MTSPIQTRQPQGQSNLLFYSYAITMNLFPRKCQFLNRNSALKYEPILKITAILESELGLFPLERQLFPFEQLYF